MDFISIKQKPHNFEKVNIITLHDSNRSFDLYKCKHCGLQGKRYGWSENLLVDITLKKVKLCDGRKIEEDKQEDNLPLGKVRLKFKPCVVGVDNLKEGDIIDIVRESERGVWIKGEEPTEKIKQIDSSYNGEILLLFGEFEKID